MLIINKLQFSKLEFSHNFGAILLLDFQRSNNSNNFCMVFAPNSPYLSTSLTTGIRISSDKIGTISNCI